MNYYFYPKILCVRLNQVLNEQKSPILTNQLDPSSIFALYLYKIMHPNILKPQNPNRKKLLIMKSSKESLDELTEVNGPRNGCRHEHGESKQKRSDGKANTGNFLPPIDPLTHSRISISLPPELKTMRKSSSTSSVLSVSRVNHPSLFSQLRREVSLEETLGRLVEELVSRGVLHLHFGKYLLEVRALYRILLFAVNSFNNSRHLSHFARLLTFPNFQQLQEDLEQNRFSFTFAVSNQKRLNLVGQTVNELMENEYKLEQESEGKALARRNQELLREIEARGDELRQLEECKRVCMDQISALTVQARRLRAQVAKENEAVESLRCALAVGQQAHERAEANRRLFSTFMLNFNQNTYSEAANAARRIEEELRDYADFLDFHPLGRRPYQRSKHATDLEKMLTNEQNEFCRFLAESQGGRGDFQTTRAAREFLGRMRNEYGSQVGELLGVIEEKTDFIAKFAVKLRAYADSQRTKEALLNELTRIVDFEELNLEEAKLTRQEHRHTRHSAERDGKATVIAERVVTLYRVAASFL